MDYLLSFKGQIRVTGPHKYAYNPKILEVENLRTSNNQK